VSIFDTRNRLLNPSSTAAVELRASKQGFRTVDGVVGGCWVEGARGRAGEMLEKDRLMSFRGGHSFSDFS